MRIALAQINTTVGDLAGNAAKVVEQAALAREGGAGLVVFPELTLTGYPPEDLLDDPAFVRAEADARAYVASRVPADLGALIGGLARNSRMGKPLLNTAYLYANATEVARVPKALLPTYDVFNETRHFASGTTAKAVTWNGHRLGIHTCEDMWNTAGASGTLYARDPVAELAAQGVDAFINICASPFSQGKHRERQQLMRSACQRYGRPYVFVNQVGANTDLIFDGRSGVMDADGSMHEAPPFEEALLYHDMNTAVRRSSSSRTDLALMRDALAMGIRDYFCKTGVFKCAFIGLSGGIDSAVTCALAVRALGAERVTGVAMPSMYSSPGSIQDAEELAGNLGIRLLQLPIHGLVDRFDATLEGAFTGLAPDVTEENIQARTRGTLLMALTNKFSGLLLATGNKSEMATGYATLYGDMNGGLGVLGDVFKTDVYRLARLLNEGGPCIPEATLRKPPSAELRPDQTDQDSLPPYDDLDRVLRAYIEHRLDTKAIADQSGLSADTVRRIIAMVDRNEFKRRQAPPILRVSQKAFGRGRALPVVARRTTLETLDPGH